MVRKMMQREITNTTVRVSKMEVVEGKPVATELEPIELIGNQSLEGAQKQIKKMFPNENVQAFEVIPDTNVYELPLDEFIKHATVRSEKHEQTALEV